MLGLLHAASLCQYVYHVGGVHEFVFKVPSQAAVDEWFAHLSQIYVDAPKNEPIHLLVDMRQSGMLPMTYTIQAARKWLVGHVWPHDTLIAFLHNADFPVELMQTFLRLARLKMDYEMAFFGEREKAVNWLLAHS